MPTSRQSRAEHLARMAGIGEQQAEIALDVLTSQLGSRFLAGSNEGAVAKLLRTLELYARRSRSETRKRIEPDLPPGEWVTYSALVMDQYRGVQRRILGLFDLTDKPLETDEEITEVLDRFCEKHGDESRERLLEWPEGVYRIVHAGQGPSSPVMTLATQAGEIARKEGLTVPCVVRFLLADKPVVLPWIEVEFEPSLTQGRDRVHIMVGSTQVRPEEVAAAYAEAIDDPFRDAFADAFRAGLGRATEDEEPVDLGIPYVRSRVTDRVATMVSFVDAWKRVRYGLKPDDKMQHGGWPLVAEAFAQEHPEERPFPPASMNAQYIAYKRRTEKKGADDGNA